MMPVAHPTSGCEPSISRVGRLSSSFGVWFNPNVSGSTYMIWIWDRFPNIIKLISCHVLWLQTRSSKWNYSTNLYNSEKIYRNPCLLSMCIYIYICIYGVCVTVFVPHVQISFPFKTSFIGHFSSYPCLLIAGYSQLFLYILLQFHNSIVHETSPWYPHYITVLVILPL